MLYAVQVRLHELRIAIQPGRADVLPDNQASGGKWHLHDHEGVHFRERPPHDIPGEELQTRRGVRPDRRKGQGSRVLSMSKPPMQSGTHCRTIHGIRRGGGFVFCKN